MGLADLGDDSEDSSNGNRGGSREYVQPDIDDFTEFLEQTGYHWQMNHEANAAEYVFDCNEFAPDFTGVVLRIFSTIDLRTDRARSKGEDAIRLVVFDLNRSSPLTGHKKTLRITTWRDNLQEKIDEMMAKGENELKFCSECNSLMVIRSGKYGDFYGCSEYPSCDYTEDT